MIDANFIHEDTMTPEDESHRGQGLSEPLLLDPHRRAADLRLANRAVRERWKLPSNKCDSLVDRLFDIAETTSVRVRTLEGYESQDGPADVNAIAAARVIVQMMGQNQADELPVADNQVNVNIGFDVRAATRELLKNDPDYLRCLDSREADEYRDSVTMGEDSQQR